MTRESESGFEIEPLYAAGDVAPGLDERLGEPGAYPFTRGIYPTMYTERPWTMRQYAGFGTAAESNARYHQLLKAGTSGLSVAFDLPTQMGMDSDAPLAHGEVGKVGVAIDSIEDMRILFDGIPLDKVSTSMTINAPAAVLLLLYQLVAEEQGIPGAAADRHDPERRAQGVHRSRHVHLPAAAVAATDRGHLRLLPGRAPAVEHDLDLRLPHGRGRSDAGAGGRFHPRGRHRVRRGRACKPAWAWTTSRPRLSFFFVARTTLLEEVAKFRAARRIWARVMRDEFGATEPEVADAALPHPDGRRPAHRAAARGQLGAGAVQALAAVLGGTQSLHTNSFDEAIALPTEKAARLALRTQQVLANETDVTATVDPFAGSYLVESMTDAIEAAVDELMDQVEELGGAVAAIEQGFQKREIERSAYAVAQQIDSGERVVVGVNRYVLDTEEPYEPLRVDPAIEVAQRDRLAELRADRDATAVDKALDGLVVAAAGAGNVLYPMKDALRARATVGEVCDALRGVWGTYRPPDTF